MITTVGELIEALEDFDPDAPLLLATQPSYPIAYHLARVAISVPPCDCDSPAEAHRPDCPAANDAEEIPVVWLVEGDHPERPCPPAAISALSSKTRLPPASFGGVGQTVVHD